MALQQRTRTAARLALAAAVIFAMSVYAHEVLYNADLDASETGSGSSAHGTMVLQADEHEEVFDVLSLVVDGIDAAALDNTHGPNMTAIHVLLGGPDAETAPGSATAADPIVIDLGWYINAGFGTLTPTATGFEIEISAILTAVQGAYDMTAATGMTPADVLEAMEEGETYIQIDTQSHPGGEIRGSILPATVPTEQKTWGQVKFDYRGK